MLCSIAESTQGCPFTLQRYAGCVQYSMLETVHTVSFLHVVECKWEHAIFRNDFQTSVQLCARVREVRNPYLLVLLQKDDRHFSEERLQGSLCLPRQMPSFQLLCRVEKPLGKSGVGEDDHNRKNGNDDGSWERNCMTQARQPNCAITRTAACALLPGQITAASALVLRSACIALYI